MRRILFPSFSSFSPSLFLDLLFLLSLSLADPSISLVGTCMPYVRRLYYYNKAWPNTTVNVYTQHGFDKTMVNCANDWKFQMIAETSSSTDIALYKTDNVLTKDFRNCATDVYYNQISPSNSAVNIATITSPSPNGCNGGADNGSVAYQALQSNYGFATVGIGGTCEFKNCDSSPCASGNACTDYINSFTCTRNSTPYPSFPSLILLSHH